jgi:anti-anti-sigma factor
MSAGRSGPSYELAFEQHDGVTVARLRGEVDSASAPVLEPELLDASDAGSLVVDLREVSYLDSAGMAMLDTLRRARRLHLVLGEGSIIRRTLGIVGFDQLIPVASSVDAALAGYRE